MSEKPKIGGIVRISYQNYFVLAAPLKLQTAYRITICSEKGTQHAYAELWRCGCGPWQLAKEI